MSIPEVDETTEIVVLPDGTPIPNRRKKKPAPLSPLPASIFADRLAGWSETRTDLDQSEYVRADIVKRLTAYLDRKPELQRRRSDTLIVPPIGLV